MRIPCGVTFGLMLVATIGSPTVRGDATVFQQIVVRKVVELLPDEIGSLFSDNASELEERCLEPDVRWAKDPDLRERARWHYVMLDLDADQQTRDARLDAASRFPHEQSAARKLYGRKSRPDGGSLPWKIEDLYQDLVDAFGEGSSQRVLEAAGHLLHFATDATIPFNATVDRDGTEQGNVVLGRFKPGERYYEHQNLRRRFCDELIRRNRQRYEAETRLGRDDVEGIANPRERSFAVLTRALESLDAIIEADQRIIVDLNVIDADDFGEVQQRYYDQMDDRCGDVCVERLTAAAKFGASLIVGAWKEAGSPRLDEIEKRVESRVLAARTSDAGRNGPVAAAAPAAAGEVVGSRNSDVYHRPDCEWAKKITPRNLVKFRSGKDAIAEKRRACTGCNPGS